MTYTGIDHDELVKYAEKNFSRLPTTYDLPDLEPCRYSGSLMTIRDDDMPYAHIALTVEVHIYIYRDDDMPYAHIALTVEVHIYIYRDDDMPYAHIALTVEVHIYIEMMICPMHSL